MPKSQTIQKIFYTNLNYHKKYICSIRMFEITDFKNLTFFMKLNKLK